MRGMESEGWKQGVKMKKERRKKERIGIVVSDKPQKTIVVAIQTRYQHPKYKKIGRAHV